MLPDQKIEKRMVKSKKRIKYYDIITGEGHYNDMTEKYVYVVEYPDGTTEQIEAKILAENMISQVDYEGHHYKVLTEVTVHKRDDCNITKVHGLIQSINGNLHWKRTTRD